MSTSTHSLAYVKITEKLQETIEGEFASPVVDDTVLTFKNRYGYLSQPLSDNNEFKIQLEEQLKVVHHIVSHKPTTATLKLFEECQKLGLTENHAKLIENIESLEDNNTDKEQMYKKVAESLRLLWNWENLTTDQKDKIATKIGHIKDEDADGVKSSIWVEVFALIRETNNSGTTYNSFNTYQPSYFSALNQPPINLFTPWQAAWEKALNDWRKNVPILPGVPTPPGLHPELPSNPFEMVGPVLVAFATGQPLDYGNQLKLRALLFKNVNLV